ncbi:hypothetical protein ACLMYS_003809 [Salmonella enterica]
MMTGTHTLMVMLISFFALPIWSMAKEGPERPRRKVREAVWLVIYMVTGFAVMRLFALWLAARGYA